MDHKLPLKGPHKLFDLKVLMISTTNFTYQNEEVSLNKQSLTTMQYAFLMLNIDTVKVASNQKQLPLNQNFVSYNISTKYDKLFDWSLGVHLHQTVVIDLLKGLETVYHHVYPITHANEHTLKKDSNTWLIMKFLKNVVSLNGPHLASLWQNRQPSQTKL